MPVSGHDPPTFLRRQKEQALAALRPLDGVVFSMGMEWNIGKC